MKLVQSLASVVTGFVMLATVGSASASAAEFDLSGTFASTDSIGYSGLAGGSFDGTFSYSGEAITSGGGEALSSYSINLLTARGIVAFTFSSNDAHDIGAIQGTPSNSNSDILFFYNPEIGTNLELAVPTGFQGTGNLTMNNVIPSAFTFPMFRFTSILVTSATSSPISQSVPEPSTIAGTIAAGAGLMVMGLKKSKNQKGSQAA
jgi:hypothetical protein